MAWNPESAKRLKAEAKALVETGYTLKELERNREQPVDRDVSLAVDNFTSSVETLLTAIAQRSMTEEQIDRLARILQGGERDLLRRLPRARRKAA